MPFAFQTGFFHGRSTRCDTLTMHFLNFSLPLSDPRCVDPSCHAYAVAQEKSLVDQSFESQMHYGRYTTFLYLGVVLCFAVKHAWSRIGDGHRLQRPLCRRCPLADRLRASWRAILYRKWTGKVGDFLQLPPTGTLLLVALGIIAITTLTFAEHPYYRPKRAMGSAPLGLRAGMIATALLPLVVALAGKANFISVITGIGHEKLNALHRCISWIILFASIIHVFPFIYQPLKEGGLAQLNYHYYHKPGTGYTGTPTFAVFVFLVTFSLPAIRRRNYELFKRLHHAAAIIFLVLMFWHAARKLDAWYYLIATTALWAISVLTRFLNKSISNKAIGKGYPTSIHLLRGGATSIEIKVPNTWNWRPGQHAFLRMPSIGLFDNHPFTIASIPSHWSEHRRNSITEKALQTWRKPQLITSSTNILRFLIRPHSGFTRRLQQHCHLPFSVTTHIQLKTIVDGPYGTYVRPLHQRFDEVLLVAGGGGITAMLPFLLSISHSMKAGRALTTRVHLIWMVRDSICQEWLGDDVRDVWNGLPAGREIQFDIHVTDGSSVASSLQSTPASERFPLSPPAVWSPVTPHRGRFADSPGIYRTLSEQSYVGSPRGPFSPSGQTPQSPDSIASASSSGFSWEKWMGARDNGPRLHMGARPKMMDVVDEVVRGVGAGGDKRVAVMGCGPAALKTDLGNAVANVQKRVWRGELKEVMLHTETFDW